MDSMRSLNTSLPSSTPRPQPSEQLLQSFKAAALSVTNLYKNAVCEQAQARQAGYQDALEDLLHFLDRENLGLGDGEGWKVRQWATEKHDGTGSQSSDEEERGDAEKRDRSSTPAATRKEAESTSRQPPTSAPTSTIPSTPNPTPRPETTNPTPQAQENFMGASTVFTFTAGPTFPQCQDDMDLQSPDNSTSPSQDGAPVSVLMPRNTRQQHRHNNLNRPNARFAPRESPNNLGPSLGTGLGSKRKFTVPDFFDLSGLSNGRDLFGEANEVVSLRKSS